MQNVSRFVLLGCLALSLAACDDGGDDGGSGGGGAGGSGNSGGAGGAPPAGGVGKQVTWNDMGTMEDNDFGIIGSWYSYDDCADAMKAGLTNCTTRDSGLVGPDSEKGWTVRGGGEAGEVCAKGTVTKVEGMMYAKQWGFGIAFDLNSPPGGTKAAFDAAAKNIKGFGFDIGGTAPPDIRINLTRTDPDNDAHFKTVLVPTNGVQVLFSDTSFKQGSWVMPPTPFTPNSIYSVQFQVYTNDAMAKPFDFCVKNFRVIE